MLEVPRAGDRVKVGHRIQPVPCARALNHGRVVGRKGLRAATDGRQALDFVRRERIDLIILDVLLPGPDGIEVCAELRKITDVPIVFLSCKDEEIDKVTGLVAGADDYITKPFSPRELVARIKAHLRRYRMVSRTPQHPSTSSR